MFIGHSSDMPMKETVRTLNMQEPYKTLWCKEFPDYAFLNGSSLLKEMDCETDDHLKILIETRNAINSIHDISVKFPC